MAHLKILHFADSHIDIANYGRYDAEYALPVRVVDFLKSLDQIVDRAIDEKRKVGDTITTYRIIRSVEIDSSGSLCCTAQENRFAFTNACFCAAHRIFQNNQFCDYSTIATIGCYENIDIGARRSLLHTSQNNRLTFADAY